MNRFANLILFNANEDQEERQRRNRAFYEVKLYKKSLRQISRPFLLDPEYFIKQYRLHPNLAWNLVLLLEESIVNQGPCDIPVDLQVLAALKFFAEGGFQKGASEILWHPTSQPIFSRLLSRVVRALCSIANQWIRFPRTREERQAASNRFLQHNRIPGILGLLDCFVVKIIRPSINEETFFNYKHGHSFNVQVVSGEDYIIYNLKICPGSNNDRFIWKYSDARHYMRSLRQNPEIVAEEGYYYLLADSGYTASPILLTPVRNALPGSPNALYTTNLCGTRCKIEQTLGQWTNKFMCVSKRRVLHYLVPKAAQIIVSSAVLHNYYKLNGVRPAEAPIPHLRQNVLPVNEVNDYREGLKERARLINEHYNIV